MNPSQEPRVSVVTPVYNGEKLLETCIRSVLAQTHTNFDYTIVNNCSSDRTLEVAQDYASRDERIRVHDNDEFLSVVDNHNKAFSLISDDSVYTKCVGADDWLFPHCIAEMVKVAEEHPTVGMVSSYVLAGKRVAWDGLPYPSTFVKGSEICRMRLLDGLKVFGGPSSSLLRSSTVREKQPFYTLNNYHGDNDAYLHVLQKHDFGFVHQVLTFLWKGEDSATTSFLERVNSYLLGDIEELRAFGDVYLSPAERERCLRRATRRYYRFLAETRLKRDDEAWQYHRERTQELGTPIDPLKLSGYIVAALGDRLLNPKRTLEGLFQRLFPAQD